MLLLFKWMKFAVLFLFVCFIFLLSTLIKILSFIFISHTCLLFVSMLGIETVKVKISVRVGHKVLFFLQTIQVKAKLSLRLIVVPKQYWKKYYFYWLCLDPFCQYEILSNNGVFTFCKYWFSIRRSISPFHCQYLWNIGV